jgi:hypothetical protein
MLPEGLYAPFVMGPALGYLEQGMGRALDETLASYNIARFLSMPASLTATLHSPQPAELCLQYFLAAEFLSRVQYDMIQRIAQNRQVCGGRKTNGKEGAE